MDGLPESAVQGILYRRADQSHLHAREIINMSEADKQETELHELGFYVQRNIRYHMRRGSFFLRWSRFTAFVGVIFGSAAVTGLVATSSTVMVGIAALVVTLASAVDLVVGTGQRSWLHNDLRKRYLDIEAEMLAQDENSQISKLRDYKSRIRRIEADEPPTLPVLELLARNDVIRALYPKDKADLYVTHLGWLKRLTAQWYEWDTSEA